MLQGSEKNSRTVSGWAAQSSCRSSHAPVRTRHRHLPQRALRLADRARRQLGRLAVQVLLGKEGVRLVAAPLVQRRHVLDVRHKRLQRVRQQRVHACKRVGRASFMRVSCLGGGLARSEGNIAASGGRGERRRQADRPGRRRAARCCDRCTSNAGAGDHRELRCTLRPDTVGAATDGSIITCVDARRYALQVERAAQLGGGGGGLAAVAKDAGVHLFQLRGHKGGEASAWRRDRWLSRWVSLTRASVTQLSRCVCFYGLPLPHLGGASLRAARSSSEQTHQRCLPRPCRR